MRIIGPGRSNATTTSGGVKRAGGGGVFRLEEPAEQTPTARSAPTGNVQGIDSLLVLQGEEDLRERRRRAVARGRKALDLLEDLKLSMLTGEGPGPALARLERAAQELKESSGDPGLDAITAEIQLRAAVELAKFERER